MSTPPMSRTLAEVTVAELFSGVSSARQAELVKKLQGPLLNSFQVADEATRGWIRGLLPGLVANPAQRPPGLVDWLRQQLGLRGLETWMRRMSGRPGIATASNKEVRELVELWLDGLSEAERQALLAPGLLVLVDQATNPDLERIQASYQQLTVKEMTMASYYFDTRGLPPGLVTTDYKTAVENELKNSFGLDTLIPANQDRGAAIIGMMLLDEQFAPSAFGFRDALQKIWVESLGKTLHTNGSEVPNNDIYVRVAGDLGTITGHGPEVSYQELAYIARYVIANAKDVPLGHSNFSTQVRIGLDRYVAGSPASDSLILPPLTGDDGSDVEIVDENVRAIGMVYAAYQLERMRLFHVVDRITELFMNGMLPIGFDNSGKALDAYHWEGEDRLSEPARRMTYARVLGAAGADVSKEVQPNREFESLFLRILSNLAEYDRQRRIGNLFDNNRRSLTLTGEQVRKSVCDFARNASLYGWGGTHFAARRLNAHIATAVNVLKLPQIQKAYGVSNPWQVVERVAATELGGAPNVVKYRTMAESGKAIIDLVAKHAKVWSTSTGNPLFNEDPTRATTAPFDIPTEDQEQLMRHTQYWLAVNGVADDQVDKLSQPSDTVYAPSIPSYGGSSHNGAGDAMEKIKQMVQSGSAPSIDQLKQMFPI